MDLSSINLEDGAEVVALPFQAYCRVETIADFHDAVRIALDGCDVSICPVEGALYGLAQPMLARIVRRVSDADPTAKPERVDRDVATRIKVHATSSGIAAAVRTLLRMTETGKVVEIDLTPWGNTARAAEVSRAFEGFVRFLAQRAGRQLTRNDIADMYCWIAQLGSGRVDAQVPYAYAYWGSFMVYEAAPVDKGPKAYSPPPRLDRHTRALVCSIPPRADDLVKLMTKGNPFGIVNARALRDRAPWAAGHGLNPDKTIVLPHGTHALYARYKPRDSIISTEGPEIPDSPGVHRWGNVEARYQSTWDDLSAISAHLYGRATNYLPPGLQDVWAEQREKLRPYAILVEPVVGDLADLARHALAAGIKARRHPVGYAPKAVLTARATTLDQAVERNTKLIGYGCAVSTTLGVEDVDTLLAAWDGLVGIEVVPAG